jgi:hypothetical protein
LRSTLNADGTQIVVPGSQPWRICSKSSVKGIRYDDPVEIATT